MPLSEEQKRQLLVQHGYDPVNHVLKDDGRVIKISPTPSPTPSTNNFGQALTIPSQRNVEESSALKVAAKSAAQSALPAAGALAGGALLAAPFTGGSSLAIPIIAGLAGALGGGYATSKAQEALVPEDIQRNLFPSAEEIQAHPYAAIGGSLIPSTLAFSPTQSIKNLLTGGKTAAGALASGGRTISDAQAQAIKALALNTALNVGTGAGLNIARQVGDEQPFDLTSLLLEAGASGLLNQPRAPFRRFFGDATIPTDEKAIIPPSRGPLEQYQGPEQLGLEPRPVRFVEPPETTIRREDFFKAQEELKAQEATEQARLSAELEKAKTLEVQQQLEQQKLKNVANENTLRITRDALQRSLGGEEAVARPEIKPSEPTKTVKYTEELARRAEEGELTAPLTEAEQIQREYDLGRRQQEISRTKAEESYQATKQKGRELIARRGLRFGTEGQIEGAGLYTPPERRVDIGPEGLRGGDTPVHETTHAYMLDLAASSNPKDHALLEKGFKATGNPITRDEYIALNQRLEDALLTGNRAEAQRAKNSLKAIEEPLADALGVRGYRRFTYGKGQELVQWAKDVVNHAREKLNLGTPESFLDFMSGALLREAPYGTRAAHLPESSPLRKFIGIRESPISVLSRDERDELRLNTGLTEEELSKIMSYKSSEARRMSLMKAMEKRGFVTKDEKTHNVALNEAAEQALERINRIYATNKEQIEKSVQEERQRITSIRPEDETGISDSLRRSEKSKIENGLILQRNLDDPFDDRILITKTPDEKWRATMFSREEKGGEYIPTGHRLFDTFNEAYKSSTGNIKNSFGSKAFEISDVRFSEQSKLIEGESGKDYGEEIAGELGKASVKAASEAVRAQQAFRKASVETFTDKTLELAEELGKQLKIVNPKIKNLDEFFLGDEIQRIAAGDKDIENAYRKRLGDEFIDELKDKIDKELLIKVPEAEEAERTLKESRQIASKKAEEYGAFTREDTERQQERSKLSDDINIPKGPFKFFSGDLDIMRGKGNEHYTAGANALDEDLNVIRQYAARYEQPLVGAIEKLNRKQREELYKHLLSEDRAHEMDPITSGPLAASYAQFREGLNLKQQDQIAANQPVKTFKGKYRLPIAHDYYMFNVPSHKVIETLNIKKFTPEYNSLKQDYISHIEAAGYTPEEAQKAFKEIEAQYGGSSLKTNFGAVRREEGPGLPESWIEKDLLLATKRYINRVSRDRAWFDTIESDPYLNRLFGGERTPFGEKYSAEQLEVPNIINDPLVRRVAQQVAGFKDYGRITLDAPGRVAVAAMLGPLTGIADNISTIFGMLRYVKFHQIPKVLASYKDVFKGFKNSIKTGLNRKDATSIYEVGILSSSLEDRLNQGADIIYKLTGRAALERLSRSLGQAAGETITTIKLSEARAGDKDAKEFLSELANQRDYEALSIEELGTRIAQKQQGTYDVRQQPHWVLDSSIAPFLKLSRWNIGQANEFSKSVVNKAIKGDISPLIISLFGSLAGGYIIKELREVASNKADPIPSLKEIAAGGKEDKLGLYSWNVASALAYAGFAGMLGDIVKSTLDVIHDNKPQGFTFPTIEVGADLVAKSAQAAKAISEGENPVNVAVEFNKDFAKRHIQVLRLVLNNLDKVAPESATARDFRRTEYRNTLRKFKQVEGEEVTPLVGRGLFEESPFEDLEMKEFKRTEDISQAVELLPQLISKAIENSQGDPYKLKAELRRIKQNSYQTMPSPESMPISFASYIQFLNKTQGADKASEILTDYFRQRAINKAKASLVP